MSISGHYHSGGNEYCESCLPDIDAVDWDQGEQDSPANCHQCGQQLFYTLTSHGVKYVVEQVEEELDDYLLYAGPPVGWFKEAGLSYYKGMPQITILREWVQDVLDYNLSRDTKRLCELFLLLSEGEMEAPP